MRMFIQHQESVDSEECDKFFHKHMVHIRVFNYFREIHFEQSTGFGQKDNSPRGSFIIALTAALQQLL